MLTNKRRATTRSHELSAIRHVHCRQDKAVPVAAPTSKPSTKSPSLASSRSQLSKGWKKTEKSSKRPLRRTMEAFSYPQTTTLMMITIEVDRACDLLVLEPQVVKPQERAIRFRRLPSFQRGLHLQSGSSSCLVLPLRACPYKQLLRWHLIDYLEIT